MKPPIALVLLALASSLQAQGQDVPGNAAPMACKARVYLTLDTGNMRHADLIAATLARHQVKATFFLANEAVFPDRKRFSLDDSFGAFWKARVAEGHAFGSHTWRHGNFGPDLRSGDVPLVSYRPQFGERAGQRIDLDQNGVCAELDKVNTRFLAITGKRLSALWRAPGGRTTPFSLQAAKQCGYTHVHWAAAGFLGDELPSETYPNDKLLTKALNSIRDGDILMGHLGIWSRKEPFAPLFDPLIAGLKARGFCFSTMLEHPSMHKL